MTNAIKLDLIQEEENDETMFKSGDLLTNNRNKSHSRSIILNSQNLEGKINKLIYWKNIYLQILK